MADLHVLYRENGFRPCGNPKTGNRSVLHRLRGAEKIKATAHRGSSLEGYGL